MRPPHPQERPPLPPRRAFLLLRDLGGLLAARFPEGAVPVAEGAGVVAGAGAEGADG
jgi:hypothetical protein